MTALYNLNNIIRKYYPKDDFLYYIIIDTAKSEEIHNFLYNHQDKINIECLFQGEILQNLADILPYLIQADMNNDIVKTLFETYWDKGFLYIIASQLPMDLLRRHLRKFNIVYDDQDQSLLFRYYDPIVMHGFLKIATKEQKDKFFGEKVALVAYPYQQNLHIVTCEKHIEVNNIDRVSDNIMQQTYNDQGYV